MSEEHKRRASALIARLAPPHAIPREDAWRARDAHLEALRAFQKAQIPVYGRLSERFGALPVDVLRHARATVHEASEDIRVFLTSGTTQGARGAHPFRDLSLYDQAAKAAAAYALFPDGSLDLCVLAPSEEERPESSLSYMLARFGEWFGERVTIAFREGKLDLAALSGALERAQATGRPLALLGTSFAFVHAEDAFAERGVTFALPDKSRVMQTGGFKGRSREFTPPEMRSLISSRYDVPASFVVSEYGMTELSSQMYELTLRHALNGDRAPIDATRRFFVPDWVRVTAVDPERLQPVAPGEVGILRIEDGANVDSVAALQTADFARVVDGELELLGRDPDAVPRGCSLAIDEVLSAGDGAT